MRAAPVAMTAAEGQRTGGDALAAWAEGLAGRRGGVRGRGCLRFAFYGRVSTEDWQDPESSRARQLAQAAMLVAGRGVIMAEFFDTGESRTLPWPRRPQAAAVVAALADPDRGWDAIVIGEYERAFYGSQYASMAPLFEHYGISAGFRAGSSALGLGEFEVELAAAPPGDGGIGGEVGSAEDG